jgi:ComF family protein
MTLQVYQALPAATDERPQRFQQWLGRVAACVAPPHCLLCGGVDCATGLDLCRRCETDLPDAAPAFQPASPPLATIFSPWRYDYPVDQLVRALKFHGDRSVARTLGALLARHRGRLAEPLPELVVPVPLHSQRLRDRGYNQADEIARYVAAELGMRRQPQALRRIRDTAAQSQLSAASRRRNLADAFQVRPASRASLAGRRIALIDDVVTTGSTARAAAAALFAARAAQVELWTLARAE